MSYLNLFSTPVYNSIELELRDYILPVANYYINKHGTPMLNNKDYISTYSVDPAYDEQQTDVRLNPLSEYIRNASKQYLIDSSIDPSPFRFEIYYLFNRMTSNGSHGLHAHPSSVLSGVFYLNICDGSPPIIFNDPRDYYKYIQYPIKFGNPREMYKFLPEYVVEPVDGMILIWPSWLEHQVPFSRCNGERIAVAFNII